MAADVILPVALTVPPVAKLPAVAVPVALINPPVNKLPVVVLPVTVKLPKLPTLVKLLNNTFEESVLPINPLAKTLHAATPVN